MLFYNVQPPDFESALNIAKLKEVVSLSRKSNNGQEDENFEELQSNPSEEEIKQSVGHEFNVWSTDVQNNGNRRINRKFRSGKVNRFRYGGSVFSRNPKLGSYGSSKPNFRGLYRRNNLQVITIPPSDLVLINVLSVTLEILSRMLLKRMFKSVVMFCLIPVSLLSRQTLQCLNLKLPSHLNKGVLKKASLKMSVMKIFCL